MQRRWIHINRKYRTGNLQANRGLFSCPGWISSPNQMLISATQMPLGGPVFQVFEFFMLIPANTVHSFSFGRIIRHLLWVPPPPLIKHLNCLWTKLDFFSFMFRPFLSSLGSTFINILFFSGKKGQGTASNKEVFHFKPTTFISMFGRGCH